MLAEQPAAYLWGNTMATENILEKLNMLNNLLVTEDVQLLQQHLYVKMGETTTGDKAVDANFATMAQNAKMQITAANRRIEIYKAQRETLQAELDTPQP